MSRLAITWYRIFIGIRGLSRALANRCLVFQQPVNPTQVCSGLGPAALGRDVEVLGD